MHENLSLLRVLGYQPSPTPIVIGRLVTRLFSECDIELQPLCLVQCGLFLVCFDELRRLIKAMKITCPAACMNFRCEYANSSA